TRTKLDRLTVRRVPISVSPGLFAFQQRARIGQALGRDEAFEGGDPMLVVVRPVIGLAAIGGSFELARERRSPFAPREMAGVGQLDGERERLRLPRLLEHGLIFVA